MSIHELEQSELPRGVNPMQTDGFEFVEFTQPTNSSVDLARLFQSLGFTAIGRHKTKNITLYRQGEINFLLNMEPQSFAYDFAKAHGPSACSMAFRVKDVQHAIERARSMGAEVVENASNIGEINQQAIKGIGGSLLFFVDQYESTNIYDAEFDFFENTSKNPIGHGLGYIDHLTHNVYAGNMDQWATFYQRFFNFHQQHYFDISGQKTGLVSRAMVSPCGKIRIPINESDDEKSQIVEFLNMYNGEGIQHIALTTNSISHSIDSLRKENIDFMEIPSTYYEVIQKKLPNNGLDMEDLSRNNILIDGEILDSGERQLLLQIFTKNLIGPIFFEIIQRLGHNGFGEGNFTSLFESIELDQMRRGVL